MYDFHSQSKWAESTRPRTVTNESPALNDQMSLEKNITTMETNQNDFDPSKYGDYVKWFKSRPEWLQHDNHPDEIEMCGGCGTTRMFHSNGSSRCYRCSFPGPGIIYRKIKNEPST